MNPLLAPAVFEDKRGVEAGIRQSSSESWNGRESLHGDRPGCFQEAATGRDSGPGSPRQHHLFGMAGVATMRWWIWVIRSISASIR